jgi:hypothetical protein
MQSEVEPFFLPSPSEKFTQKFIGRKRRRRRARVSRGFGAVAGGQARPGQARPGNGKGGRSF